MAAGDTVQVTVRHERETQTKTLFLAGRPDDRTREKIETVAKVIEPFDRGECTSASERGTFSLVSLVIARWRWMVKDNFWCVFKDL